MTTQTVQTDHPQVCVHTRLTDEVEDWKIQRSLQLVREMGAATVVDFFPWAYIEGSPGAYDWHHPDRILAYAHEQGIQVIARLGLVPDWARPKASVQQTSLNSLTPAHYADYARFVGAFAARYRGTVTALIAWNEPNLSFEWGYRSVAPAEYIDFLRHVYAAAHAANPDVIVLGGALAPTLSERVAADISQSAYIELVDLREHPLALHQERRTTSDGHSRGGNDEHSREDAHPHGDGDRAAARHALIIEEWLPSHFQDERGLMRVPWSR